jgi:hypothetical protein
MSRDHRVKDPTPGARIFPILTTVACAAAAWAIGAGSVLAPEPADLVSNLSRTTGATAAAVVVKQEPKKYLLWPETWQPGANIAAGTPCSPYGLPAGTIPKNRIQASGNLRRCFEYDPLRPPPTNAARPLPPMPMDGGGGQNSTSEGVAVKVIAITTVVSWPSVWTQYTDALGTRPYAGQPCSNFALYSGESTYKHIQGVNVNNDGTFRCVANTEPIYVD